MSEPDPIREAFEKHAIQIDRWGNLSRFPDDSHRHAGEYVSGKTEIGWRFWKEAWRQSRDALATCPNPLAHIDKPMTIQSVLRILASREGCDGEPWDQMIQAADRIDALESKEGKP